MDGDGSMAEPAAREITDESLVAAIATGDAVALGQLYDRHARLAIAVAHRVLGEQGAAEDAVQDAFVAVWRRASSFDPARGAARAWLLTIVRNCAIDRRRGRHARALSDAPLDDVAYRLATSADETFATVAASVEATRVRAALQALPADQRGAIELAYFGGLTQHEIAEATGAPLGTVKGRIRLGLRKLREELGDLLTPPGSAAAEIPGVRDPGPPAARMPIERRIRPVITLPLMGLVLFVRSCTYGRIPCGTAVIVRG
jgi:RNA polymerase sigma-70 factor (ECF subfamily)